jgi:hypothetical protein
LFAIFERGLDPTTLSSEELKSAFREGKSIAEKNKEKSKEMDMVKERMSAPDQELTKSLEKTIGAKGSSESERIAAVDQMATLHKKYGYDVDL